MTATSHSAPFVSAVIIMGIVATLPACTTINHLTGMGSSPTPLSQGASPVPPGVVQQVQLVLQQQGTYSGSVDGVWGPATQEAVRSYQQAHRLASSGQIDSSTLASLSIGQKPTAETEQTAMSDGSQMSESNARKLIESHGFIHVNGLYQDDNAVWRGIGTRGGKTGEVALDARGNVVTN